MRSFLEAAGCEVTWSPTPPHMAWVDAVLLEELVQNLLNNAGKYGHGQPVEIDVRETNENLIISVTDGGIGIAPEDQNRIFRAFERAVSSNHFSGFGLGLAVCSRVAAAHGGKIEVQSKLGEGARFTVHLPRADASSSRAMADVGERAQAEYHPNGPKSSTT
jgi:signal transduction histidine kinase